MPRREGEARDGADATGDLPPPPPPPPAPPPPPGAVAPAPAGAVAVVIAVSEADADRSAARDEEARGAAEGHVEGERKGKGKGKGEEADRGSKGGACVVIDVGRGGGGAEGGGGGGGDGDGEKVCRICHLSPDQGEEASELIQLGCGCKDDLGIVHRHCAEAWFKLRGNRCCEICGSNAKNITGIEDARFMEEWHERRITLQRNTTERGGCWRRQPFCNFLMACLVIAFILPWFFRVNVF
ncbi:E3 ubiquitin-protein ligase MARCH11-like [Ananas comosus]|uniref:E3 ubiquitin-protein ligase MARCH1 n=2 Tax=Ananas comosus TaxID=4615 RepID=A0A199VP08_ANACO|nr:E3 ubiquitin-protein ligase MARCH11-like [Ananas comosus]OAY78753.1 E3 ubiquitin-protein ligase MARCH1 [Ananas comosus]CAD1834082.1 unnamed protein product [Ananas comosus var. bracteatus]